MSNPIRPCQGCSQYDDHPRHTVFTPDGGTLVWHMDCHAIAAGCEACRAQIAGAPGATGEQLRAHLVTTGPSSQLPGWTAPDERGVS